MQHPRTLIIIGAILLVTGFALPLLMVMQILPSTFFLNFFAYGASFVGLILGLIGTVSLAVQRRGK